MHADFILFLSFLSSREYHFVRIAFRSSVVNKLEINARLIQDMRIEKKAADFSKLYSINDLKSRNSHSKRHLAN